MKILTGDSRSTLKTVESGTAQTCVTSPPYYGLRDYGMPDQIGLEETPEAYVEKLVQVFREVKRALKDDGTLWLNLGDSYYNYRPGGTSQPKQTLANHEGAIIQNSAKRNRVFEGIKEKDLIGIPWMVAFALRADGWYLRSDIIWHKPNPMPESVTDRPTRSHEYIFLFSKSQRYYYDAEAIKEDCIDGDPTPPLGSKGNSILNSGLRKQDELGKRQYSGFNARYEPLEKRNKRDVWTITTKPYKEAHFATFPPDLIEPCILAGSRVGDIVLDPFSGSGTTGAVSLKHHRDYIGCELNPDYVELTNKRFSNVQPVLMGTL